MNAIVCELCGSNDIIKQDGLYVCQHCGTKYSLEEAKKLLGTVKIDRSEEFEKYMKLARSCAENKDIANAETYFEMALKIDPTNIEALVNHTVWNSWNKIREEDTIDSFIQVAFSLSSVSKLCLDIDPENERLISYALDLVLDNANGMISYLFEYRYQKVLYDVGNTTEHKNALNKNCYLIVESFHKTYLEIESKLKTVYNSHSSLIIYVQTKHLEMLNISKKQVSVSKLRKDLVMTNEHVSPIQRAKTMLSLFNKR